MRIQNEARRTQQEVRAVYARAGERLREYVQNDVANMRARSGANAKDAAKWLHMKSYDDTYRDYSAEGKRRRTRVRIERLLELAGGDRQLLMREYSLALSRSFPLPYHLVWAPRFITSTLPSGKVRVTMRYHQKHRPPSRGDADACP